MATLGVCSMCERVADSTCGQCGRAVCPRHTAEDGVRCVACARGTMGGSG